MRCPSCNTEEQRTESRFCRVCGAVLPAVTPTLVDADPPRLPFAGAAPVARTLPDVPPRLPPRVEPHWRVEAPPRVEARSPVERSALARLLAMPGPKPRRGGVLGGLVRSLVALVASMLATHGVGALHEQIGADMAGGLGEILPVPPALQSEIVLLALTFASSVIVSFLVFRLSTPRPAPRGRSALYTLAFALVLAAPAAAYAEVPEHNPGLDHTCPPGFQYSRGPIACKQADCPAGAGRTYTYDCSCGEAWDRPFRTCRDASGLAVRCVPSDQECDDTAAKIGGGFFIGVGGFILRSTMHAAVAGTGPIGWGLVFGGAAVGYGVYLWTRGRPRRLDIGARITREILERVTRSSRVAVEALNARMRAGLSEDELQDLQVVYEKYINLSGREREQMREELAREGVDTVKLGEAIRWYRSLPPGQQ